MSIHFQNEKQFERWRRKARELRARSEHFPEDVPVILELLNDMGKLQCTVRKHERRIRTLEAQIGKCYAHIIPGNEHVEQIT